MFSRARLDTLSDGIFGAAKTLLILDVRVPCVLSHFHPRAGDAVDAGAGLNRRHAFADQANGSCEPELVVQGGEYR